MKIRKPLALFLSLLFAPCFLTSCSFNQTESTTDGGEDKIIITTSTK